MRSWDSRVDKLEDTAEPQGNFEPLDWMSETYQLICREYRQSLGLVDMHNYESKYECESERRYWSELYRIREYGEYKGKEVISDPPIEFVISWLEKDGGKTRNCDSEDYERTYDERQAAFEQRIRLK
ncbi:MAG TPA: hypothetical protein VJP79_11720 [Nitrososphaera sp.]|nr:hypothetical protein [Nitrososphaera sp.]